MVRVTSIVVFSVLAGAAQACPSFGLETDYLAEFFCRELGEIAGPATRNMSQEPPGGGLVPLGQDWMDLAPVSEAWRVDPAATLELIERIRAAGGRAQN